MVAQSGHGHFDKRGQWSCDVRIDLSKQANFQTESVSLHWNSLQVRSFPAAQLDLWHHSTSIRRRERTQQRIDGIYFCDDLRTHLMLRKTSSVIRRITNAGVIKFVFRAAGKGLLGGHSPNRSIC